MSCIAEMLCLLCYGVSSEYKNLFDAQEQQTNTYRVVAMFFEEQLQETEEDMSRKSARVICTECWMHIYHFHCFKKTVLAAQTKHKRLIRFEECIKLETQGTYEQEDVASVTPALEDPVKVGPKENSNDELSNDMPQLEDLKTEDPFDSTDDDKPLITRLWPSVTHTSLHRPVKGKTKIGKKSEKSANKHGSKTREYDAFIIKHWKGELNCELCDFTCANFTSLTKHFRKAHDNVNPYVVCCQIKFPNRFLLVDHLQLHLDPQFFKCPECGKCCSNRRSLVNHTRGIHGPGAQDRRYECEICHKRFAKKAVLRGHMETHATGSKDYVCRECGKGFVLQSRYNIHVQKVHSNANNGVCELCGKSFRNPYTLKAHLLEHEGVKKRKWPCDECDAQLHSKFSLSRHKRLAHHDGSTAYVCGECGKVALTEDALRSHKRYVHECERKYKCTICGKAFKVAVVLKEHMTTHTGEALYQCPHCPKTFKISANMHHHRKRVHPKEWAEKHRHRRQAKHADLSQMAKEIVL